MRFNAVPYGELAFEYCRYFEDKGELWKRANIFHEMLRGNLDYLYCRIILNVDEENGLLTVTQYKDSDTDIWVDHVDENHVPVLRIKEKKDD